MATKAFLRRERLHSGDGYHVRIGDAMEDDDGLRIDMGPVIGAWWEVPLPPCPDCGGDIVWWEAGYVPGTRKCVGQPTGECNGQPTYCTEGGCGSLFSVQSETVEETSK